MPSLGAVNYRLVKYNSPLPLPLGEVPQCTHWGGEGKLQHPLSQKSKIFASSPRGRAKSGFAAKR